MTPGADSDLFLWLAKELWSSVNTQKRPYENT
jgi:hypothetical protein